MDKLLEMLINAHDKDVDKYLKSENVLVPVLYKDRNHTPEEILQLPIPVQIDPERYDHCAHYLITESEDKKQKFVEVLQSFEELKEYLMNGEELSEIITPEKELNHPLMTHEKFMQIREKLKTYKLEYNIE